MQSKDDHIYLLGGGDNVAPDVLNNS